jgi:hypothetical protein
MMQTLSQKVKIDLGGSSDTVTSELRRRRSRLGAVVQMLGNRVGLIAPSKMNRAP